MSLLLLFRSSAGSGVDLTTDLVSYWKLDEATGATRVDFIGSNDLTDHNSVVEGTTGGVTNIGDHAQFTRASSMYLDRANASLSGINGTDRDFTVSFWVKFTTIPGTMGIVSLWDGTNGGWMFLVLSDGTMRFYLYPNSGGTVVATSSGAVTTGSWYHIVGFHDSVNNVGKLIINDGTPVSSAHTTGVGASTADFRVGSYGGGSYLDGAVDDIGFWDKVLSAAEITELYNAGGGDNSWLPSTYTAAITSTAAGYADAATTFEPPVYTATVDSTAAGSSAGAFTFEPPIYTAAVTSAAAGSADAAATFEPPIYTASVTSTAAGYSDASASYAAFIATVSIDSSAGGSSAATATVEAPIYTAAITSSAEGYVTATAALNPVDPISWFRVVERHDVRAIERHDVRTTDDYDIRTTEG